MGSMLGANASLGDQANFRRLHSVCYTLYLAVMKNSLESTDHDATRQIPTAERKERSEAQQKRLGDGLEVQGELEPSHQLCDAVLSHREKDRLVYLPPEQCTSRSQELRGVKKFKALKLDDGGNVKVVGTAQDLTTTISNELDLRNALQRRGVAYDQAGLLNFACHEKWVRRLFGRYSKTPPPGYSKITMAQLELADEELFVQLLELTGGSIAPLPGQTPTPLEKVFDTAMDASDVSFYLTFLATAPQRLSTASSPAASSNQPPPPAASPKSKGKGKSKSKPSPASAPQGVSPRAPDGRNVCFGFNSRAGCSHRVNDKNRCRRGFHICGRSFHDHSLQCPSQASAA
eukprot:1644616-Amphidinium_carterae.3